jgi:hypothetical protein
MYSADAFESEHEKDRITRSWLGRLWTDLWRRTRYRSARYQRGAGGVGEARG